MSTFESPLNISAIAAKATALKDLDYKIQRKKIKQLFIETNHENAYREYMTRNIEQAYDKNSGKSIENRSEIIQGSQQSNAEEVMENPEDRVAYDLAKLAQKNMSTFIMEEKEAVKGHHGNSKY